MTVLLTGGAGYIGSHVAVELLQSGYDVIIADTFYNSSQKVPIIISEITGKSVRTYYVDIQNSADLEQIFKQHEINAVMHFAGYKAVGESVQQPLKYYRGNLDSTLTLLETMSKYQVKNLIFSSSATVYGNPATLPITEACPTGDIASPYGWTKYMIEQIITDYAAATPDFQRSFSLFQSGGSSSKWPYRRGSQWRTKQFDAIYHSGGYRKAKATIRFWR